MKKKMIFALLLAGSMFGMVNNVDAAYCTACGVACTGDACIASDAGVSCKNGKKWSHTPCPKVVAPAA